MKLSALMKIQALLLVALGIAFALYGPLVMAFFRVSDHLENALSYWYMASFVRMFGAAIFSLGFLLWATTSILKGNSPDKKRSLIIAALTLGNLVAAFVAIIQQVSLWNTPAGWGLSGFFLVFGFLYGYFWITGSKDSENSH